MRTEYILVAVAVSAVITFGLRAFPFALFGGSRKMPETIVKLGKVLPATIMAVLIVYCVKDSLDNVIGTGIPKLIAVLTVAGSYKWKHNTFVSIAVGTLMYMVLLRIF
ncbi:MAG TPA: branched-chain amino acid permease [Lachnospiraceae bacterium]|nr:branched-chain amino acid permease [Lachnospiraceae bacterium]